MIIIVMHNNKNYLETLRTLLRREGIFNSTVIAGDNIGKRLIGDNENFISQTGTLLPAYDKALVTAVQGEEQLKIILNIMKGNASLTALNIKDKGFVCTVPFSQLKSVTLETVKLEKNPELDAKICNLLTKENILLDLEAQGRKEAIYKIGDVLKNSDKVSDFNGFMEKVLERENLNTTGIGDGVAIPHARTNTVKDLVVAFGRSFSGVDFSSLDGKPAKLIFLIGSPSGDEKVKYYLKILARLAKLLRNSDFRDALIRAATSEEIVDCFKKSAETIK